MCPSPTYQDHFSNVTKFDDKVLGREISKQDFEMGVATKLRYSVRAWYPKPPFSDSMMAGHH